MHLKSYPHQLSGGMRQRAMIAMALLFTPDLVIMDEPTSALDVVAQRSLMVQIKELQQRLGFAVVFVTHDMSLVSHFSDRLVVMYAAQAVEIGPTRAVFDDPGHPYTPGPARRLPVDPRTAGAAHRHPRQPAQPAQPAGRVPVRAPVPAPLRAVRRSRPPLYEAPGSLAACHLHAPAVAEVVAMTGRTVGRGRRAGPRRCWRRAG